MAEDGSVLDSWEELDDKEVNMSQTSVNWQSDKGFFIIFTNWRVLLLQYEIISVERQA